MGRARRKSDAPQRVLLYGGTFDPPHRGHVELPLYAALKLACDEIIYIPTNQSPHKQDAAPTDAEHRLAMLEIALRDVPMARISTLELDRGGVSYFIDTVRELWGDLGLDTDLRFLIGADQALAFHDWKDWPQIIRYAYPAVMLRAPWTRQSFAQALYAAYGEKDAAEWLETLVETPQVDVRATDLRTGLATGDGLDDMIDPVVLRYIREHGLYGATPAEAPSAEPEAVSSSHDEPGATG